MEPLWQPLLSAGQQLLTAGQQLQARQLFAQAQQMAGPDADFFHALGLIWQQAGHAEAAETAYRQALTYQPDSPETLNNLALLLWRSHPKQALALLEQGLECPQMLPEQRLALLLHRAQLLNQLAPSAAPTAWQTLLEEPAAGPREWLLAVRNLRELGEEAQAMACNQTGLQRYPGDAPLLQELLNHCEALLQFPRMLHFGLAGLKQLPAWERRSRSEIWLSLARAWQALGEGEQAHWAMAQAQEICPRDSMQLEQLLLLPAVYLSVEQAERVWEQTTAGLAALLQAPPLQIVDPVSELKTAPFYLAFQAHNLRPPLEQLAQIYQRFLPESPPLPQNPPKDRIRVGFLSHFWYAHSVVHLFESLVTGLDPQHFEVCLFAVCPARQDAVTERLARRVPLVRLQGPLIQQVEHLHSFAADILVYTDLGSDPFTWLLAHLRLAPTQAVLPGLMHTTGIPNLDFYLAPDSMEPPEAEAHYSETLIRTPWLPVMPRQPQRSSPLLSRSELGLPEQGHLYLFPMTPFKFHPAFDAVMAGILEADPQAHLVVLRYRQDSICQKLAQRWQHSLPGGKRRILWLPWQTQTRFLHLLEQVDVVLDSWPVGGGNTVFTCLGLGIPIVSWASPWFRGRVALGAYRQMGVAGPVAESADACVDLAVRLAQDPSWRRQLQTEILARNACLFENPHSLAGFSELLQQWAQR